jgi:hypothetical protein
LNLITIALGRNVYDYVSQFKTAHDVGYCVILMRAALEIKSPHKDTYNRQYQTFSQKAGESLNDCFVRFECIVSNLRSCGPLAYSDNECAKQLLYTLDDHVWDMKITTLEESVDFATLDTKKLFSKLKSYELSHKGHPNHDASLTSKDLITSACVGGHDANPTNTISSTSQFDLSTLAGAFDEQYTSSTRRGGDHQRAALSVATPPTSSLTVIRGRSLTPPTSTTTPTGMTTTTKMTTSRRTALETTTRRSPRRSCPGSVLP